MLIAINVIMKLLNLGCGQCYHHEWVNLDFTSENKNVISHNLLRGIPFGENEFDAVYHSHVLEHFNKEDAKSFICECFRVLKADGIIRIAVPDFETIAKEYLSNLNRAVNHEFNAEFDYEWIMLEMYDQTVRNSSGGQMAKYLYRNEIPNKDYVFNRIGNEGRNLHESYLKSINKQKIKQKKSILFSIKNQLKILNQMPKYILMQTLFRREFKIINKKLNALEIGQFRLSGEIHQWMYDRYSLSKLLTGCGFKNIKVVSPFESSIINWEKYQLDSENGIVRKPDSLFIEATK